MPPGTPTGASCPKHFQPHTRADRGQTHETRVSRPCCVGHGSASRRRGPGGPDTHREVWAGPQAEQLALRRTDARALADRSRACLLYTSDAAD
ncbi:hypothetical protein EF908_10715, partial [Streptomyces sp. WAC04770]